MCVHSWFVSTSVESLLQVAAQFSTLLQAKQKGLVLFVQWFISCSDSKRSVLSYPTNSVCSDPILCAQFSVLRYESVIHEFDVSAAGTMGSHREGLLCLLNNSPPHLQNTQFTKQGIMLTPAVCEARHQVDARPKVLQGRSNPCPAA